MKDLHTIFVPLVIGTISLIAWLSVRNESVSSRIRKTVDDLLDPQKVLTPEHVASLQAQLLLFVPRYKQNTIALRSVICSGLAFGFILGVWLYSIFSPAGFDASEWLVFICFGVGSLLVLHGTVRSIQEIQRGQLTLYTHVANCLEERPVKRSDKVVVDRMDEVISIIREAGIDKYVIEQIQKSSDKVKNPARREQDGTGQPATRPESKSEGSDKPQPEAEGRSR
jgi:hypothetical protein